MTLLNFKKRTINLVYSEDILKQKRDSPWGNTQRDQKEGLEFSITEYDQIDEYCKNLQLIGLHPPGILRARN